MILPGSLVQFKSGGAWMTVKEVFGSNVKVQWFEGTALREEIINSALLKDNSVIKQPILFG
jgi:uncharacterized protein YodC (DUF2158 family)